MKTKRLHVHLLALPLAAVLLLALVASALADPGDLDPTFDGDGRVTTDFGFSDWGYAVALQPDGKIVVAGGAWGGSFNDFALARYNSDGSLDTSFGTGAQVITDFNGSYDSGRAVALQPDGKIVVAGGARVGSFNDFALARYEGEEGDTTPPEITPTVLGTPGDNGWYVSDVTVSWNVTDPESEISETTGCDTTAIDADTAGITLICTATSAGGTASESVTIKHDATAPKPVHGGPFSVDEGSSVTLYGTGSTDALSGVDGTAWALDGDSVYDDSDPATFIGIDGPSTHPVSLKAVDLAGNAATADTQVTVDNVAPTANFANTSGTVFEGELATLVFSNESDPSTADTAAGFLYSYDCTDDGTFELAGDPAPLFECPYPSAGTFTARGIIEDKDGGSTDYTVVVTVLSPQSAADTVIDDVQDMVDTGTLNQGKGTALIGKLDAAIAMLNQGRTQPAINLLQALINQVNDLIDTGVLTAEQGQPLIDTANRIINSIA